MVEVPAVGEVGEGWRCDLCGQSLRVKRSARRLIISCACHALHYKALGAPAVVKALGRALAGRAGGGGHDGGEGG